MHNCIFKVVSNPVSNEGEADRKVGVTFQQRLEEVRNKPSPSVTKSFRQGEPQASSAWTMVGWRAPGPESSDGGRVEGGGAAVRGPHRGVADLPRTAGFVWPTAWPRVGATQVLSFAHSVLVVPSSVTGPAWGVGMRRWGRSACPGRLTAARGRQAQLLCAGA